MLNFHTCLYDFYLILGPLGKFDISEMYGEGRSGQKREADGYADSYDATEDREVVI